MARIKGITVTLIKDILTGTDPFGHPIYAEKKTIVDNVLVSPISSAEIPDALNLTGKKVVYNVAVPKGDKNTWKDQKVEFFGRTWQVVGFPKRGIDENIPLEWNDIWRVADYEYGED